MCERLVDNMTIEVDVDPDSMDELINSNTGQIIYEDRFGHGVSVLDKIHMTDGTRIMTKEPLEVLDCFFEPLKVTIYENGAYVPYLWTDQKVINIAMMSGRMNGELLREDYEMYKRYMVARW